MRIKRQNQVFFVVCNPEDKIQYLKEQVALAVKHEWKPDQMRLILPTDNSILENSDKISRHEDIKNDSELYATFQISEGQWESVHVEIAQSVIDGF